MRCSNSRFGAVIVLVCLLATNTVVAGGVRVVAEHELPAEIQWASDVRWLSDRTVLLASAREGSYRLSLADTKLASLVIPVSGQRSPRIVGEGRTLIWAHTMLGASERFLAVAAPSFELAWVLRKGTGAPRVADFMSPVDLDVHEGRLLVVGLMEAAPARGDNALAIVWETDMDRASPTFRPRFHLSGAKPRIPLDDWLHASHAAKARFCSDGSFLVVPGVEPGAFWYGPDGRLLRAWSGEELGLDVAWAADPQFARKAASQVGAMLALRNTHRFAEEVLPLPGGPAVITRQLRDRRVFWTATILRRDGSLASFDLPIQTTSPNWALFGDVWDDRIVLVLFEICERGPRKCSPSRLIELEVMP